jgi:hypothetical protein
LPKRLPHLVRITDTQTGLELVESWKSVWVRVVGIAVLFGSFGALALIIFGSFVWGGAILGGILVIVYPVMAYNANSTRVHINTRFVDIKHGPILYRKSIAIPSGDVADIIKTPRKKTIDLEVQLRSGRKVTMLMGLADDDRTDFIIRQARRHLNLVKAAPLPILTTPKFASGRSAQTIAGDAGFRAEYA